MIKGKITINRIMYIELDVDPTTVPGQVDAPVGSLAIVKPVAGTPSIFLKTVAGNATTSWQRQDNSWRVGGNNLATNATMGLRTDFELGFIRNNQIIASLGKRVTGGFSDYSFELFKDLTQTIPGGKLVFRDATASSELNLSSSIIISTDHLDVPALEHNRKSIVVKAQGDFATHVFNRSLINMKGRPYVESVDTERYKIDMSAADRAQASDGAGLLSKIAGALFKEALEMVELEVSVIIKRADGSNMSHFKKTCSVKLINSATRDYQILFQQDDYTYHEGEVTLCSLALLNNFGPATSFNPAYTGSCGIIANLSGLANSTNYDVSAYVEIKGLKSA